MKLNEREVRMFESLRSGSIGKELVQYVERLQADICDIRKFGDKDTVESAQQASKRLDELKKHLINSVGKSPVDPNEFI